MNYWPAEVGEPGRVPRAAVRPDRASCASRAAARRRRTTARAAGSRTTTPTSGARRRPSTARAGACGRWAAPGSRRTSGSTTRSAAIATFLRKAYPVLKEAAEFFLDFLVEDEQGRLVTNPSHSPENAFLDEKGNEGVLCVGATMDLEIIRDLFGDCMRGRRGPRRGRGVPRRGCSARCDRLPPYQIGKHGQLQEWLEDFDEAEPGHRHISHLFAPPPGPPDHAARHAGAGEGGARLARAPAGERRRRHRLEPRLDRQPLGAARRWRAGAREPDDAAREVARCRTCSTPTRRSRSTATSAARRASPRCCCRATPASSTCCRRCRAPGRTAASPACARAAASRSTSPGRRGVLERAVVRSTRGGPCPGAVRRETVKLETGRDDHLDATLQAGAAITLDGTLQARALECARQEMPVETSTDSRSLCSG